MSKFFKNPITQANSNFYRKSGFNLCSEEQIIEYKFFELTTQSCVYTPLTLSDEEKGEIGGMTIFNDKGKINVKEQEGIAQIARDKGEAVSKENPESFIMNSYTTLSSAVGGLGSLGKEKTVNSATSLGDSKDPWNAKIELPSNLPGQGKVASSKDNETVKKKCALASTGIKKVGRNKNIYNITFDGPHPFNIFEMKPDAGAPSDYVNITCKLSPKDTASAKDGEQQLQTTKTIVLNT